ncbi:MAG: RluA family pseudouridine synthase [Rickettsiales bacterium]|jgi:23S rRNA pseudouridine1911/1915/1917 synthase|nr:RluA family pseudouridine synthase [Rickettsiales bacterium]
MRLDKTVFDGIAKLEDLEQKYSRNRVQDLIEIGLVRKNGLVTTNNSERLKKDDEISVEIDDSMELLPTAEKIELNILYEDDDLMVVDKQSRMTVHPGAGNLTGTLVNALLYHCGERLSDMAGTLRPGIVHRLDKDTSGLMVVAKNNFSHTSLREQLRTRELKRIYNALVWGIMVPRSGEVEGYMARHERNRLKMTMASSGRYSLTSYRTLTEFGKIASLVECSLSTGRTHQIRVHLSSRKHPLIGDRLYGGISRKIPGEGSSEKNFIEGFTRQALHSKCLDFRHPRTKKSMSFEIELPADMQDLVGKLSALGSTSLDR